MQPLQPLQPHMDDIPLFEKYLKKATIYGEFGSGGSTCYAAAQPNIKAIYSVESDPFWIDKVRQSVASPVNMIYIDLGASPNNWGNPGPTCTVAQKRKYSSALQDVSGIDTLLIDGRFRVACLLKSYAQLTPNSIVMFDDFLNRPYYHIVLQHFDILEKGKTMVILKKNSNAPDPRIIEHYETVET